MSLYKFALKGGTQLEQNVDKATYNRIAEDKNFIATDINSDSFALGTAQRKGEGTSNPFFGQMVDSIYLVNQQTGGDILIITDADTDYIASGHTLEVAQRRIYYTITGDTDFQTVGIEFTLPPPDECFDKLTYVFHCEDNLSGITPYVYFNDAYSNLNFDPSGGTIGPYNPLAIQYWQPIDRWMFMSCINLI